jgi:pimeloyl-ACP methyl ester carboxylesterase
MAEADFDLQLGSGRVRARRYGAESDRLVIGIPGLSANLASLAKFGEAVPIVAIDVRGRGHSETTPAGTYGWDSHARDVLEIATQLGHERFSILGHSMGAGIGMHVARMAPQRLERLAMVDLVAPLPQPSVDLIRVSISRLGSVYPSLPEYLALVRGSGLIPEWGEFWEAYYRYEMTEAPGGGVVGSTDRGAVEEDFAYGLELDYGALWPALTMPVLLLRARRPMVAGTEAHIVTPEWLERFRAAVPQASVVEIDATHYTIAVSPGAMRELREFFAG